MYALARRTAAKAGDRGRRFGAHIGGDVDRRAQPGDEFFEPRACAGIRVGRAGFGIHHQRELAGEVVDDGDFLRQHQQDVGRAERVVVLRPGQPRLDVAHRVVAEATDQPAGKARQAVARRHLDARHELADKVERVDVVALLDHALAHPQQGRTVVGLDARVGGEPDDRIAAKALAALHRFEQVGVRRVGQFQVDRQRGVEIGEGLDGDRDAVIALRRERVEFSFQHGDSTKNQTLSERARGGPAGRQWRWRQGHDRQPRGGTAVPALAEAISVRKLRFARVTSMRFVVPKTAVLCGLRRDPREQISGVR